MREPPFDEKPHGADRRHGTIIFKQNEKIGDFRGKEMRNPKETIGKMIDKANTSFIAYVDDEGYPITKAMLKPRERNGIKEFWFSTNTSSRKVKFFRENPKASVYFIDKRFFRGVSLLGTVEILETSEAKEQIWRKGDTMYYKEGVTDPDYCVLKFTAVKGRYYSNFKSEDFEI